MSNIFVQQNILHIISFGKLRAIIAYDKPEHREGLFVCVNISRTKHPPLHFTNALS